MTGLDLDISGIRISVFSELIDFFSVLAHCRFG